MSYIGEPSKDVLSEIIRADSRVIKALVGYMEERQREHAKICCMHNDESEIRRSQGAVLELEFLMNTLTNAGLIKGNEETKTAHAKLLEQFQGI
jgi:hypothetical protein